MTEASRGARPRRGGRGTGWYLLTALLVLAILASATLVFTSRVELLRLAVILALWAAVLAAFVTVVYRRQSELDQARARDLKLVYDLQLDREISARREYELSIESNLRRSLSQEIRAEAADELAALRTELVSLRSQLEAMFGTDLGHRPALESDRVVIPMPISPGRVESSRVTAVVEESVTVFPTPTPVAESSIIDVPEAPLVEPAEVSTAPSLPPLTSPDQPPRNLSDDIGFRRPAAGAAYQPPQASWRPPHMRPGRHASADGLADRPEPQVVPDHAHGRHGVVAGADPSRHRGASEPVTAPGDGGPQGQHTDGQSFAELMARLQVSPSSGGGGGRRRRREDAGES